MNQYATMREPIGTPAVYSTLKGDLYISIMNIAADKQSAGIVVIYTPMVSWIWFSVLLMGLGGVVALIPARRVIPSVSEEPVRAGGAQPSIPGAAQPPGPLAHARGDIAS